MKEIEFKGFKFSTSDISYLVNHSIHLEKVSFQECNICDDGLIITKEADKLKYLESLNFFGNSNITDESIINLVNGCHNLENINLRGCPKLTDTSLFNIATNCPNLEKLYLNFKIFEQTTAGLIELLKKCPKLTCIKSINCDF